MNLFDKLRQPVGHQARGCWNCKHHTEKVKCAKASKLAGMLLGKQDCVAYFDEENAAMNLVNPIALNETPHIRKLWQRDWEWNGK